MKETVKSARDLAVLRSVFLFRNIRPEKVRELYFSEACICALFEENETIYTRTDFRKSLGVVVSGRLSAVKPSAEGTPVLLNTFLRGGIFGAAGLFTQSDRYVSEIIAGKRSKVMFLPEALLRAFFREEPQAAENYIVFLSGRIRFLNTRIDHFTAGSAKGRLISFLLSLPMRSPGDTVELPCSMTHLADVLDIGRASLYRAFDALQAQGAILRSEGRLVALNPDKLKTGE